MGIHSASRHSLCPTLLCLVICAQLAAAHVQLTYPPSTSNLDFLDNIRTKNLCGDEASGADNSGFWRLPKDHNNGVTTTLQAGDVLNATWNLHYAHQGGWRFELYDKDAEQVAVWNDSSHWGCNHDGTQQWVVLELPPTPCENCTLRLVRQALEWGPTYLFHSCGMVSIKNTTQEDATCNGCSGHGKCVAGQCECDQDPTKGFWEGTYCERQNECEEDTHCGEGGLCVDTGATSPPRKQCYCKEGWFGEEVTPWAPDSILPTRICNKKSNLTIGDPGDWESEYPNKKTSVGTGAYSVYYKVDKEKELIEFAIEAKTDNWVAVGMRAAQIRGISVPSPPSTPTGAAGEPAAPGSEPAAPGAEPAVPGAEPAAPGAEPSAPGAEPAAPGAEPTAANGADGEGIELDKEKDEDYEGKDKEGEDMYGEEKEGKEGEAETGSEGEPGAASEGEPAAASEGEPAAASEGDGGEGLCGAGNATVSLEDTFVLVGVEGNETAKNKTGRRLFSEAMPELEHEAIEVEVPSGRRLFIGRHLSQAASEPAAPAASEPAAPAASEPGSPAASGRPALTYFGPPKCRNPLVDNPAAHPMINQDIVVGYAQGNAFRIQDSFTPSRARPLPDVYFGGTDDIVDAVGREEDGTTYLKFQRKLQTDDKGGDYCIIENVFYLLIYAYGQPAGDYTHIPNSSLETGRATNKDFYGRDELKFHGGGIGATYEGRGVFGQVDFFQEPKKGGACEASTLEGYDCMQEAIPGSYVLHWRVEEDGVAFAGEATGAGWVAVAWPTTPGQMVGAEAVIGWTGESGEEVDVYRLTAKSADAVVPVTDAFDISDESVEEDGSKTVLRFTRKFDDDFQGTAVQDMLVAFHAEADELAYHTSRQSISVNLLGEGQSSSCEASTLEGYECMEEVIPGSYVLHWTVGDDDVALAGEASGAGWVAIGWPETAGQMVGAEAVIGWTGDGVDEIDVYRLTGKSADAVVPVTDAFAITNESIEEVDGKTILRFTRSFDDEFQSLEPQNMLVAYHSDADELAYHSNRQGITLNFVGEKPDSTSVAVEGSTNTNSLEAGGAGQQSGVNVGFSSTARDCIPSTLDGFDCMVESSTGGDPFLIHWAVEADRLRLAGQAPGTGFCALGWAQTAGQMVGGRTVIGWSGPGNDQIDLYALNAKAAAAVVPSSDFEIFDESVEEVDGSTIIQFSRLFDDNFSIEQEQNLLVAFSPDADALEYHGPASRSALTLNFGTGGATIDVAEDLNTYWKAHGILMTAGWGILIPIGIIAARTMKDKNPLWFYIHIIANMTGLLTAAAGFVMAIVKFERDDSFRHRQVGISAMVLGILQPLNAVFRPHHGKFLRAQWEWVHWTLGRAALVLAIWNIFTGLDEYEILGEVGSKKYHVIYGMVLLSLFLVYLAAEGRSQKIKETKCQKELQERVLLLEKNAASDLRQMKTEVE